MSDPQPPQLPDGTPQELRDFVSCVRATFTLSSGKADWLPVPGTITLSPGANPGTGTLKIQLGEGVFSTSFDLPVTVSGGQLNVDTSNVPEMGTRVLLWPGSTATTRGKAGSKAGSKAGGTGEP